MMGPLKCHCDMGHFAHTQAGYRVSRNPISQGEHALENPKSGVRDHFIQF